MFTINAFQLFCVVLALIFNCYFHCSIKWTGKAPIWMHKHLATVNLFTVGTLLGMVVQFF